MGQVVIYQGRLDHENLLREQRNSHCTTPSTGVILHRWSFTPPLLKEKKWKPTLTGKSPTPGQGCGAIK